MRAIESRLALLSEAAIQGVEGRHEHFLSATPCKHTVIDEFFNDGFARQLLDEFPSFEPPPQPNTLLDLGPAYSTLDDFLSSPLFLKWAEALSGIRDLTYLRESFWGSISPRVGGGIHQNIDGQEQLPHADFKFDLTSEYRRRLGLMVFFNERWEREWGGLMQFHPEPQDSERRGIRSYEPIFNRCIVFETRLRARHGFSKITLPPEHSELSRKSVCVYLFTRETRELTRRAQLVSYGADVASTSTVVMLPILGYVRQVGEPLGFHFDGWAGDDLRFSVEAVRAVTGITLRVSVPEQLPPSTQLEMQVGEQVVFSGQLDPHSEFATTAPVAIEAGSTQMLTITTSARFTPRDLGINEDPRALCFLVREISFEHDAR